MAGPWIYKGQIIPNESSSEPYVYNGQVWPSFGSTTTVTADFTSNVTSGDIPLTVTFTDTSTTNDSITAWSWDFGDGYTSTEQNPTHIYESSGVYTVSLTATDDNSVSDTKTVTNYIDATAPDYILRDGDGDPILDGEGNPVYESDTFVFTCNIEAGDLELELPLLSSGTYDFTVNWGDDTADHITSYNDSKVTHTYSTTGIKTVAISGTLTAWSFYESTSDDADKLTAVSGWSGVGLTNVVNGFRGCTSLTTLPDDLPSGITDITGLLQNCTSLDQDLSAWDTSNVTAMISTFSGDSSLDQDFGNWNVTSLVDATSMFHGVTLSTTNYDSLLVGWDGQTVQSNVTFDAGNSTFTSASSADTARSDLIDNHSWNITDGGTSTVITADFTADTTSGDAPLTVNFTDTSTTNGTISTWFWDFGDGNTSTDQNPTHTYNNVGSYDVTLTVTTSDSVSDTETKTSYITSLSTITVDFTADITSGVAPLTVNFTDGTSTNGTISSWSWDFGDGNTSTDQNPTHTYNNPNTYNVTLTVTTTDSVTNSSTKSDYITALSIVTVDFTADTTIGDAPLAVQFTDGTSTNGTISTWSWDFGDGGTSSQPSPLYTYDTPGTYNVSLTVTAIDGVSDTETKTNYITANVVVTASFTSDTTSGDAPLIVKFTDTSTTNSTITSWSWDFGDGNTSTSQNPSHTYNTPGSYDISLTVTTTESASDSVTNNNYIAVTNPSSADFIADVTSGDAPLTVNFTDQSTTNDSIVAWSWDFGDGNTSTDQNPTHTYNTIGNYDVSLTVTSSTGIDDTETKINYISANTVVNAAFVSDITSGNVPLTVNFTDQSTTNDTITSWSWDFGDGNTSTDQNPSHTYNTVGSYDVILTVYATDGSHDFELKSDYIDVNSQVTADFTANPTTGDAPLTVQFADASITTGTITSWSWDFGDGNTSTNQNPEHTFVTPDTYTVTLTVLTTDSISDTKTKTDYVTVSTVVDANFDSDIHAGDVPLTVNFTDTSTTNGTISSWSWNFGDGNTSTDQNPTHIYNNAGTYTVSLTVTTTDGIQDIETKSDFITGTTVVTADFDATSTSGVAPLEIQFIDSSTTNDTFTSWSWDFGDGNTSTSQNPSHTYDTPGKYTVQLTVTTSDGSNDTQTKVDYITALVEIVSEFTANVTSGDSPLVVNFTDQSTTNDSIIVWNWDFGDGNTSTDQNPTHTYDDAGSFDVSLTVFASDGTSDATTKSDYITVNVAVTADFTSDTTSGDAPLTVNFTDTSTTNDTIIAWAWDFGDGNTAAEQNPSHTYSSPGTYDVILTITISTGSQSTKQKLAYITANVNITTDFIASPTAGLAPLNVQFNDTSITNGAIISWAWDFGDGTTSTVQNPLHAYPNEGTYTVILTATTSTGVSDTTTKTNYIQANTSVTLDVDFSVSTTSGVAPLTVTFTDETITNDTISTWNWNFGDGNTSTEQNPTHTYDDVGTYAVSLNVVVHSGNSDSKSKLNYISVIAPITITPDFVADTTSGDSPLTVHFTDTSSSTANIISWNWNFGDGNSSTDQNPVHVYANPGIYTVALTIGTDSGDTDSTIKHDYITAHTVINADFDVDIVSGDAPLTVHFTDTTTSNSLLSQWHWDFGDGTESYDQHPTHVYTIPGDYTVALRATSIDGSIDTIERDNYIHANTVINVSFSADPTNGDVPLTVTFTDTTVANNTIAEWYWDFGDGDTSTEQNPSHIYDNIGSYSVTLTVTATDGTSQTYAESEYIIAGNILNTDFSADVSSGVSPLSVRFTDLSTTDDNIISWDWDFGDGSTSIEQNPIHTYTEPGKYHVKLKTKADSGASDIEIKNDYINVLSDSEAPYIHSATSSDSYIGINTVNENLLKDTPDLIIEMYKFMMNYFRSFGDNIILSGLELTDISISPDKYNVNVSIDIGHCIVNNIALSFTETIGLSLNLFEYSDDGKLIVYIDQTQLTTNVVDRVTFNLSWLSADHLTINPKHRNTDANMLLLGVLEFTKTGDTITRVTDVSSSYKTTPLLIQGNEYYINKKS